MRASLVEEFDDNSLLPSLFGVCGQHLRLVESYLGVSLENKGNRLFIRGEQKKALKAQHVMRSLYHMAHRKTLAPKDVEDMMSQGHLGSYTTPLCTVTARTPSQGRYMALMEQHDIVFCTGVAGTGKTFLAVGRAVSQLTKGLVERIVITRPVVEAGEKLGYLPGDIHEKMDPYLRPVYDALHRLLPHDQVERCLGESVLEIVPLAYMRGRTLEDAFVVLDEAQNTTSAQMKMLLTRLGRRSQLVVTGDLSQVDLPKGHISGLKEALTLLCDVPGIATCSFSSEDVMRHPLTTLVIQAYEHSCR